MKGEVPLLHERCMRYQFEHLFYEEAEKAFAGNPAIDNHLRLNRYIETAGERAVDERADPRLRKFLHALFDPVMRNYATAIDMLGEPGAVLELNTPAAVVRARDGLHLPDVEALFDDLTRRNILVFDKETRTWRWGASAGDIEAYAECLTPIS